MLAAVLTADPEKRRVDEILERLRDGKGNEAEREELALYVDDRPDLREHIEQGLDQAGKGGEWLVRVQQDDALQAVENSSFVRAERIGGAALFVGGAAVSLFSPVLGGTAMILGTFIAGWSFVRMRLLTFMNDPYRKIKK
jgi:hypothetical protein